ncbi:ABC transporter permease [Gemmatirosa kalamazoonensis]|nr:ABC transporter permease [Gemmatirosa kalamazoonensis]
MSRPLRFALPLDLKFGFRMLVKYPGLTIVGGLAMAFAVWVGAVVFEMVTAFTNPTLPLPAGDRVVQIRDWDVEAGKAEPRALHDFVVWRESLKSVTDIGAFRDVSISLVAPGIESGPVQVAEITSNAFRIAPAAPVLGRVLAPADERAGAPQVVVIGYGVWQKRFAGDAHVIGRSVQLGDTFATVVGVMPEGFAFPVSHEAWIPLRSDVLGQPPREGPDVTVFGRLAPGVSLEGAQAELAVLGRRTAAQFPSTHEHLLPQVRPYTSTFWDPSAQEMPLIYSFNVFAVLLLVLICCNVALLMFARAATRQSELVVRSALGASRGRIIAQLFAEALVLGAVAAAVGLAAAWFVLDRWGLRYLEFNLGRIPFWFDIGLSPLTVLYACGLTLLGAAIAGVVPALKVMKGIGAQLRQGTTGGGGGVQFGGVWTAVIITQVAFTVAFPGIAYVEQRQLARIKSFPAGFAAEEYLAARLDMDVPDVREAAAESAWVARGTRLAAALETVRQRVAAEPGVLGVTFVDRLPRDEHAERVIELEEDLPGARQAAPVPSRSGQQPLREVSTAQIDPSYFDVLKTPMLAGRAFDNGDLAPSARAVIVDKGFVDQVLQGRSAVGRLVRFGARRGRNVPEQERPWFEIVGVVKELGMGAPTQMGRAAGLYLPTVPGRDGPVNIVVHTRGDPMALVPRLRAISSAADPTLRLTALQSVDQVTSGVLWFIRLWFRMTLVLIGIAILLSLAGIYSVLSFTVARRTREIGVRVALGSDRRRVVVDIFRRPVTQVAVGVVAGGALIGAVAFFASTIGLEDGRIKPAFSAGQVALYVAYVAFMFGVCLLSCVVPTRRALGVQPTEALRAE